MKRIIAGLLLLFPVLFFSGCQKEQAAKKISEVRIGVLNVPNDVAAARQNHSLAQAFSKKGVQVTFITFDSGVDANKALLSNSIDLATMGDTNAVVALAADIPAQLIWINDVIGDNEALVMKSADSWSDLAGKTIATTFASTSYYTLLKLLQKHHLEDKVQLLDMQTQDIVAAWKRGDIDGAYTWQPALSSLQQTGTILYTSQQAAEEGIITANVTLARSRFIQQAPELVQTFTSVLGQIHQRYQEEPQPIIALTAQKLALTEKEAALQIGTSQWLEPDAMKTFITDHFLDSLDQTGRFLGARQNLVSQPTRSDYQQFINTAFIK